MKTNISLVDVQRGPAPAAADNALTELLLVKRFIDTETATSLLAGLNAATSERDLGVTQAPAPPWDPYITGSDLDPEALLQLLHKGASGFGVLLKQLDPATARRAMGIRSLSDVDAEVSAGLVAAFNKLVDDLQLVAAFPDVSTPRATREIAELAARGSIQRSANAVTVTPRGGADEHLMLRWLNVTLLEEVLFPGGIKKNNRLIRNDVAPASVRQQLHDRVQVGASTLPSVTEVLRSTSVAALLESEKGLELELALWHVINDSECRTALLSGYLAPARAAVSNGQAALLNSELADWVAFVGAKGDSGADDPELAMLLLSALVPEIRTPATSRIQKAYRNCQSVDWTALSGMIRDLLIEFVSQHVEPHFKTTVEEIVDIEILKYNTGGFQLIHADNESPAFDGGKLTWKRSAYNRDLSILVYLSPASDFTGGQLWFPEQHIVLEPDQGMAVAFPSDHRFSHCVREVTGGTRYAIVGWLRCPSLRQ